MRKLVMNIAAGLAALTLTLSSLSREAPGTGRATKLSPAHVQAPGCQVDQRDFPLELLRQDAWLNSGLAPSRAVRYLELPRTIRVKYSSKIREVGAETAPEVAGAF